MLQNYAMMFQFMEVLGKKWVVPILILLLLYDQTNFSKIKKYLRITSRALSKKLKLLETLGLVEKTVIDSPKKIVYTLSGKGKGISETLLSFGANLAK